MRYILIAVLAACTPDAIVHIECPYEDAGAPVERVETDAYVDPLGAPCDTADECSFQNPKCFRHHETQPIGRCTFRCEDINDEKLCRSVGGECGPAFPNSIDFCIPKDGL
jgi:hypothetical protein